MPGLFSDTDQQNMAAEAARSPVPSLGTTPGEAFGAAWDTSQRYSSGFAQVNNQYDFVQKKLDDFQTRTGEQLANPAALSPYSAPEAQTRASEFQNIRDRFAAKAKELGDPTLTFPSDQEIDDQSVQMAQQALSRQEQLAQGRQGFGTGVAGFLGGAAGASTDPINALATATLPEGGLAVRLMANAAAFGGAQLTSDLASYGFKRRATPEYGPSDVAGSVLSTAAGAAAFEGAGWAAGALWRRLKGVAPAVADKVPMEVQDAANAAERTADLQAQSPFAPGPTGEAAHSAAVAKVEADLLAERVPEVPPAPAVQPTPPYVDPTAARWRLYHGTGVAESFGEIDPNAPGALSATGEKGAAFLTPNAEEAGRYAVGEAPRVYPVTVEPGKTRVFDLPQLFTEDEGFHHELREANLTRANGPTSEEDRVRLAAIYDERLQRARDDFEAHNRAAADMRAAGIPEDQIEPWAFPTSLGGASAAIAMARKEGLDTAILRGLAESRGGDQVAVFSGDRIKSVFADAAERAAQHPDADIQRLAASLEAARLPEPIAREVEAAAHAVMDAREAGQPVAEHMNAGPAFHSDTAQLATRLFVKPNEEGMRVVGYQTAKGSEYVVHENGTTTRNKAPRDQPGHEGDSGLKRRSERTVYVDADASALSAAGLSGIGPKGTRLVIKDGRATLLTWNDAEGRWGAAPSSRDIPISEEPGLGRHPLELWGKKDDVPDYEAYSRQHAGNAITRLDRPKEELLSKADMRANIEALAEGLQTGAREEPGALRPEDPVRARIEQAYLEATGGRWNESVYLDRLRAAMPDLDRATVDAGLKRVLKGDETASLMRNDDPRQLTAAMREAAYSPAGEPFHVIWMTGPTREEPGALTAPTFEDLPLVKLVAPEVEKAANEKLGKPPQTLLAFLKAAGGVKDEGGNLKSMGLTKQYPGLINNKRGIPLDRAREMAAEAGFLGADTDRAMAETGVNDLIDAIGRHPAYSVHDEEAVAKRAGVVAAKEYRDKLQGALNEVSAFAKEHDIELDRETLAEAARLLAEGEEHDADAAVERASIMLYQREAEPGGEALLSDAEIPFFDEHPGAEAAQGGERGAGPGEGGTAGQPRQEVRGAPESERTAAGEQTLIPGVAPVSTRARLEAAGAKPMRGGSAEPPAGGLFDTGARQQADILDFIKQATTPEAIDKAFADPKVQDAAEAELVRSIEQGRNQVPTADANGNTVMGFADKELADLNGQAELAKLIRDTCTAPTEEPGE